jgi:hypothetical protein
LGLVWVVFSRVESLWVAEGVIPAMVVVQMVPTALLYAGLYAWLMNSTEPRVRATHFALLMALLNVPRLFAPLAVAVLVQRSGYGGAYLAAGVFELATAALVFVGARRLGTGQS